jgi:hypothetical protein
MTGKPVNSHYTTAIIGGNSAGPVHGWEAIQPKPTSKPLYLTRATRERDQAWDEYLWLLDHKPGATAAHNEAYAIYERAERKYNEAYDSYCLGFDYDPIPF